MMEALEQPDKDMLLLKASIQKKLTTKSHCSILKKLHNLKASLSAKWIIHRIILPINEIEMISSNKEINLSNKQRTD